MLAPIGWRLVVECVIVVEDNVRLSAYMVQAIYALSPRARRLYRWVQYDDTAIYLAYMGDWLRV